MTGLMAGHVGAFARAPALIQLHAIAAILAMLLGAVQLLRRKGGPGHRALGWVFLIAMGIVAVSSFFIHTICQIGGFSWIHLLSVLTLVMIPRGVIAARRRQIARHKAVMTALYFLALLVTGVFTLVPGRLMHEVVFGGPVTGFACPAPVG